LGTNFPVQLEITEKWKTLLPHEDMLHAMLSAARLVDSDTTHFDSSCSDIKDKVYIGRDREKFPYGQLTDLGAHQLISVGQQLRNRYLENLQLDSLKDDFSSSVICRSTNICRTMQSICCLLYGLLDVENNKKPNKLHLPKIQYRAKPDETMYSEAGGPCIAMAKRQDEIISESNLARDIEGYKEIESKLLKILGCDKVDWFAVKEVLTCHEVHDICMFEDISENELKRVTLITDMIQETLYKDDEYNRLAIGRFVRELLMDIQSVVSVDTDMSTLPQKRLMVYSGHDSTLIPMLCALGLYKGNCS